MSFVDSPLGDLDSSGDLDGPDELVIENSPSHPYGAYELFPNMRDTDFQLLSNTAHYYAECSNAGLCNRDTGECECYDGFEGASCSRMSCPGNGTQCNGHGVCRTLKQLAQRDSDSTYNLWNRQIIRGCQCDKGFYGGDCSMRYCPRGIDPIYNDDITRVQYPMFLFAVLTTADDYDFNDGSPHKDRKGYFSIKVYDHTGQTFNTRPIQAPSTCTEILQALEAIPNRVIPIGQTKCFSTSFSKKNALVNEPEFHFQYSSLYTRYFSGTKTYELKFVAASDAAGYVSSFAPNTSSDPLMTGDVYLLQFYGNAGHFPQPEINIYTDESNGRPTLATMNGSLVTRVWSNGQQGFDTDFVSEYCPNVRVSIVTTEGESFLWGQFVATNLLKCLSTSDWDDSNNIKSKDADGSGDLWEYDTGSIYYPHLIKLQRVVTADEDGGFFAVIYLDNVGAMFDSAGGFRYSSGSPRPVFRIMHPMYALDSFDGYNGALFNVFTTKGVLQMVKNDTIAHFEFGENHVYTTNSTDPNEESLSTNGDISCESLGAGLALDSNTSTWDCLDKNDRFFVIDPFNTLHNPSFLNMYQAKSIRRITPREVKEAGEVFRNTSANANMKYVITSDYHMNWVSTPRGAGRHKIYKFTPSPFSNYEYIHECSNRGLCNTFEGTCECFPGYAGDACQVQSSLVT